MSIYPMEWGPNKKAALLTGSRANSPRVAASPSRLVSALAFTAKDRHRRAIGVIASDATPARGTTSMW